MGNHAGDRQENMTGRYRLLRTSLLIVVLIQALVLPFSAVAGSEKTIWQSREQFVAIVEQDGKASTTPPNDHPASLFPDQIRNALSSMILAPNSKHKQLPVFNAPEIDMLSLHISEALHQAGPREDVTFAVVGHFSTFVDFLKVRQITTGRVFYQDGKLNIIFGIMHRDIKENEDRRLNPLAPGSRTQAGDFESLIMAQAGEQPFSKPRGDWVVFTRENLDKPVVTTTAPAGEERRLEQAEQRPAGSTIRQTEEQKAVAPLVKGKSAEERLIQLNELKNKHLITDEEYRSKRMEILNDL